MNRFKGKLQVQMIFTPLTVFVKKYINLALNTLVINLNKQVGMFSHKYREEIKNKKIK